MYKVMNLILHCPDSTVFFYADYNGQILLNNKNYFNKLQFVVSTSAELSKQSNFPLPTLQAYDRPTSSSANMEAETKNIFKSFFHFYCFLAKSIFLLVLSKLRQRFKKMFGFGLTKPSLTQQREQSTQHTTHSNSHTTTHTEWRE